MKRLSKSDEYVIPSRRIAGTHGEKAAQIDAAMQELLDIKLLESAGDRPNVRFLPVPRRTRWLGMTMTIVLLLVLLVLLFAVRPAHAQDAGDPPPPPKTTADKPADPAPTDDIWSHVTFGVTNTTLAGLVWWIGNKTGSW